MDSVNKLIKNKVSFENFDKFAVIIGSSPSKNARSPILWNAAFKANNLNFAMLPLDVTKENLNEVIEILDTNKKFIGGSVTIPYKSDLADLLKNNLTYEAKEIGAINCIFRDKNYNLIGTNTDGEASISSFKKKFGSIKNKNILLLGLGGAGKAVLIYFLKEIENGKIFVSTLNKRKFGKFKKFENLVFINWEDKNEIMSKVDIIINCTSLGFDKQLDKTPLSYSSLKMLKKTCVVFDIIYNPLRTKFLKFSEQIGLKTMNGLEMNLLQAVIAFNYAVKSSLSKITKKAMEEVKL